MKQYNPFQQANKQELNTLETEFYIPFIKYFEGFNPHEIAHILQIPVETVKLRIKLARKVVGNHLLSFQNEYKVNLDSTPLS